jgi:hypothetical protein
MVTFLGFSETASALIICAAVGINFLNACAVARYARRKGHATTNCGSALIFFIALFTGTVNLSIIINSNCHFSKSTHVNYPPSCAGLFSWVIFCCDVDSEPGAIVNGVRVINVPAPYQTQVENSPNKEFMFPSFSLARASGYLPPHPQPSSPPPPPQPPLSSPHAAASLTLLPSPALLQQPSYGYYQQFSNPTEHSMQGQHSNYYPPPPQPYSGYAPPPPQPLHASYYVQQPPPVAAPARYQSSLLQASAPPLE